MEEADGGHREQGIGRYANVSWLQVHLRSYAT